jgi:mRNA interferase RelE/StbE
MTFGIALSRVAVSDLEALHSSDRRVFRRVLAKIETLAGQPRQGKPLVGNHKGEYSLRVGPYRVVYEIDVPHATVYVLTVKHRKVVY